MSDTVVSTPLGRLSEIPIDREILLIAPPGCGKTQALSIRAAALVAQGWVRSPRRLLALTYSNKASVNLRARLAASLPSRSQQLVQVATLHAFAGRVAVAHGKVLGLDTTRTPPELGAIRRLRTDAGITYHNSDYVDAVLTRHKRDAALDDREVLDALDAAGCREASAYERALRAENRIDFDDMLRYGARLLRVERVAGLYREHFAALLVDEVQDLSLLQLEMIEAVGMGRATYAGDPEQGIYAFAGAEPIAVFQRLRAREPEVVPLNVSYRSSPAVLRAVNALSAEHGTSPLACHDPEQWAPDCVFTTLVSADETAEATLLIDVIRDHMRDHPDRSIGVLARGVRRLRFLVQALHATGLSFQDWAMPTQVPAIVALLRRHAAQACSAPGTPADHADRLVDLCVGDTALGDVSTRDELRSAMDVLLDQVNNNMTLGQAIARIPAARNPERPVTAGLHLLTGHAGKGQEFDLVIVVGLEDGKVPDFRATTLEAIAEERRVLHVMLSRARHSLLVTRVENETRTPTWKPAATPSQWWAPLAEAAVHVVALPPTVQEFPVPRREGVGEASSLRCIS
jgi:DNA helicase-2/ATP-dependent DNA helicase PcrA